MDPRIQELQAQVTALSKQINDLVVWKNAKMKQQISMPVDLASLKTLGGMYPKSISSTAVTKAVSVTPTTITIASGTLVVDTNFGPKELLVK